MGDAVQVSGLPSVELLLRANAYPGRGVVVARTADGRRCAAYVVTGRSATSQARRLHQDPGGDIRVAPTGDVPADPIRHYTALARRGDWLCLGNGAQVPELAQELDGGLDPLTAFTRYEYSRDEPYWTPRITVATRPGHQDTLLLGASRRPLRTTEATDTVLLSVGDIGPPGSAVLVTSYQSDGEHVRPSAGYREVSTEARDHRDLADGVWAALNPDYRVAVLAVALDDPLPPELRNR